MGFIASAFSSSQTEKRDLSLGKWFNFLDTLIDGKPSKTGVLITEKTALGVSPVLCAIKILAESLATPPLVLFRRKDDNSRERALKHPLYKILHDQPNFFQTSYQFREYAMTMIALHGNFYARKILKGNNELESLIPIHPQRIKRIVKDDTLTYEFSRNDGTKTIFNQQQIFDWRGLSLDAINGESPISLCKDAIGLTISAESFGAKFFKNNLAASGIITPQSTLGEPERISLKDALIEALTGENRHGIAVLPSGIDWKQITIDPEKAQAIEFRKFQIAEVSRIYRIPPHMLSDMDNANFSNVVQQSLNFLIFTMNSIYQSFSQVVARDLFSDRDKETLFVDFIVEQFLRGDIKTRYEAYRIGLQWGVLSPNEVRRMENMNPRDDGDVYLFPLNMLPANRINDFIDNKIDQGKGIDKRLLPEPDNDSDENDLKIEDRQRVQDSMELLGLRNGDSSKNNNPYLQNQIEQLQNENRTLQENLEETSNQIESVNQQSKTQIRNCIETWLSQESDKVLKKEQSALQKAIKRSKHRDKFLEWHEKFSIEQVQYLCDSLSINFKMYAESYYCFDSGKANQLSEKFTKGLRHRYQEHLYTVVDGVQKNGQFVVEEKEQLEVRLGEIDKWFVDLPKNELERFDEFIESITLQESEV